MDFKEKFNNGIIAIYFIVLAFVIIYGNTSFKLIRYLIGTMSIIFLLFSREKSEENKSIFLYMIFIFINGIICSIYNGNSSYAAPLLTIVTSGGISILLLNHSLNIKVIWTIFLEIIIFLIFKLVMGVSPNAVFIGASENYISVLLLYFITLLYIAYDDNNKKIGLFPSLMCLLFSIWAQGRGGIISMSVLVIGMLVLKIINDKSKKRTISYAIILISLFLISIFILKNYKIKEIIFTRFNSYGMGGDRLFLWESYIKFAFNSIGNLMLGVRLNDLVIMKNFGHLHNSYLQLHAYYGLLFLVITLFMLIKTFIFYIRNKQYEMALLMIVFFTRSFTDIIFCNYYGDLFLFYFALYTYSKKSKNLASKAIILEGN